MSSRVHRGGMKVNEDDEAEAPKTKRLEEKLSNYREPIRQPFIYKVANHYLRDVNDNAHEPRMVAIGPYHHGKQSLKMMEQHKLRYLKSLLLRKKKSVGTYLPAVAEIEEEARSYYAEDLSYLSSDEFTEMLVLDGCFIIELLRKSLDPDPSDPVFQRKWILEILKYDLILFENQMPFFVLCKLFDLIHDEEEPNQRGDLMDSFLSLLKVEELPRNKVKVKEVRHLLHLTHAILRPFPLSHVYLDLNPSPVQRELGKIPSATELKDANVMFSASEGGLLDLDFDNKGVLRVPSLYMEDETQRFFRNLIIYEQYFTDDQATIVTDYLVMMDCLVNTAQDVDILSRCGVVKNMTDNQVAADIINNLTYAVQISGKNFIYADTFDRINAYYKRRWNRARAALNRDYFSRLWAYISFLAALLLLILTLLQTLFSAP